MHFRQTFLLLMAGLLFPLTVFAQSGGPESVFQSQLIELHSKAVGILDRVEKSGPRGVPRLQTLEEIFALVQLVHGLELEAGRTNVGFMRRGEAPSKALMLVQQASKSVDGMLIALSFYIESDDRAFLGFARENNALAWSVRKVL